MIDRGCLESSGFNRTVPVSNFFRAQFYYWCLIGSLVFNKKNVGFNRVH